MDSQSFYGKVSDASLKKSLIQATLKGAIGLSLIFFGGVFFIAGVLVMAWGFIPYLKLKRLSENPPKLTLTEDTLFYTERGEVFSFPLTDLKGVDYVDGTLLLKLTECTYPLHHFSKRTFEELSEWLATE